MCVCDTDCITESVTVMMVYNHLLVLHKHLLLKLSQQFASPLPLPGLSNHVQQAQQLLHLISNSLKWILVMMKSCDLTPMLALLPVSLLESSARPVSPTTFKRCWGKFAGNRT